MRARHAFRSSTLLLLVAMLMMPHGDIRAQDDPTEVGPRFHALVFSKTEGYRHASIPDGIRTIRELGDQNDFAVDATEDASVFASDNLEQYDVIVMLCTTGDVFDEAQQEAFEAFVAQGGGVAGVHSASDTEYDWPWYGQLIGAYFDGHPQIQPATVVVTDKETPSTAPLPEHWDRTDEWYNFKAAPRAEIRVLATLDESTYEGGTMGDHHPIVWQHETAGGRVWYTGMGHTAESYAEPLFRQHLLGGIEWAAGAADTNLGGPESNRKNLDH